MFEQAFKNIDDVLRKDAGSSSELGYTEQTSWLLFLKHLDALEQEKAAEATLHGNTYDYIVADATVELGELGFVGSSQGLEGRHRLQRRPDG